MDKNNILIFNFEAHKPPVFKEAKGKDYVLYGSGKEWRNRYPDYLVDLYNKSSKHNAIVNGKSNYISGRGWIVDGTVTHLEDKVKLASFIKSVGNDSLHELTKKISKDEVIFGGFALEVIVNKDGKGLTINHFDFGNIRVGIEEDTYFYTSDWSSRKPEANEDYTTLSLYPFNDTAEKGKSYLVYYKSYRPNLKEYPLPSYLGGVPYIEADFEVANYVLNNTKNGYSGGTIWNFHNGQPTDEGMAAIKQGIKDKHHGSNNAGEPVLVFDDGKDRGVEIISTNPNGQDDKFLNLNTQIQGEIFTSHGFSPKLAGVIVDGGGLANNADELRVETEFLHNAYVEPQQRIYEELFNTFATILGLPTGLKIERIAPIKSELSEQTLVAVLTTDEIRELAGYAPLEKEQQQNFSSEDRLYLELSLIGYNDDEIEIVEEYSIDHNPFDFADVSSIDSQIINIITEHPQTTIEEISKQVGETPTEVQRRINRLASNGLLDPKKTKINVTDDGKEEVSELITMYKYVLRPDAPKLKTKSRDFCRRMLALNKSYTVEEIRSLSLRQGRNVFSKRGGWYTNPNNNVRTPFCRHIWSARTVKINK